MLAIAFAVVGTADAQSKRKKDTKKATPPATEKPAPKKTGPQPYASVITKSAVTDKGLFDVHKIDEKYFYEIPDSLFNREILMVTRISKTATGAGWGGGEANTQVLRWQKNGNKVLLRVVSHNIVAGDSLPIHEAVVNSNFEPILYSFDIKAFGKDSTSTVIEVNELFEKDVESLGIPKFYKTQYRVTRLDDKRSFLQSIKSFPTNIESRHVKTYIASNPPSNADLGSITLEINNSMIILPKEPMKRRYFDERVGWFARGQVDYGLDAQKSKQLLTLIVGGLKLKTKILKNSREVNLWNQNNRLFITSIVLHQNNGESTLSKVLKIGK